MTLVRIPDFAAVSPLSPKERISTFADKGRLRRNEENVLKLESFGFKSEHETGTFAIDDCCFLDFSELCHLDEEILCKLDEDLNRGLALRADGNLVRTRILLEESIVMIQPQRKLICVYGVKYEEESFLRLVVVTN